MGAPGPNRRSVRWSYHPVRLRNRPWGPDSGTAGGFDDSRSLGPNGPTARLPLRRRRMHSEARARLGSAQRDHGRGPSGAGGRQQWRDSAVHGDRKRCERERGYMEYCRTRWGHNRPEWLLHRSIFSRGVHRHRCQHHRSKATRHCEGDCPRGRSWNGGGRWRRRSWRNRRNRRVRRSRRIRTPPRPDQNRASGSRSLLSRNAAVQGSRHWDFRPIRDVDGRARGCRRENRFERTIYGTPFGRYVHSRRHLYI